LNEGRGRRDKARSYRSSCDLHALFTQRSFWVVAMKRNGSLLRLAASPLALALLTIQLHAQTPTLVDAKCTGRADVPWGEQIARCTKAIQSGQFSGKDLAKAFVARGTAYAQTHDLDRGLADFDQAIRLDPDDAYAAGARGDLHLVKKDYEHAIADYTKAIAIEPNNAPALVGRAIVYVATGNADNAIADCDEAIRLQPAFASAFYWRGMARRLKGDAAAADADIAAAKRIDPEVDR
jgi:tetratricopeptide (TPR) repeat protein